MDAELHTTMYSCVIERVPASNLDEPNQRYYLPILWIYDILRADLAISGASTQLFGEDFTLAPPWLVWHDTAVRLDGTDKVNLQLTYTKTLSAQDTRCRSFASSAIGHQAGPDPTDNEERVTKFLDEYIRANEALDRGDLESSARAYGSALETLLNKALDDNFKFYRVVEKKLPPLLDAMKDKLHTIRELRNAIHPAVAIAQGTSSYQQLQQVRTDFETMLGLLR